MDKYRETGKVDPDYESYNSAVELNEEEDKRENLLKIKKIIEEEYNKQITQRHDQIEQIELQICKVRKLLHLLRYALIMSYYKKKELEYNGTEEEPSTSDILAVPDKQNRIHPAVKKLLGKNVNNLDHLNIKDKRKSVPKYQLVHKATEPPENIPESKKIKLELDVSSNIDKAVETAALERQNNWECLGSRKKTKYRIIVGNISKWMPSSEDDSLTHKWMVYVRGPKDKPDVSHFVDKVIYYLHPSYKPHDVVEVSESPFHLSRRGWGEFPVRVQICFKVTLNKPIDVVHQIKLDKTYSGRQMLGNETIVDVFLYNEHTRPSEIETDTNNIPEQIDVQGIKVEEHDIKVEVTEHDYCSDANESVEEMNVDHSYCLPPSHEGLPKPKKEKIEQDESNKLIYGLESYCRDESKSTSKVIAANNIKQLIQLNRKDIKFSNTKIIVFGKKVEGSFLAKLGKMIQVPTRNTVSPKETRNFKVNLPKNKLKSMGEALPYLFKRLPLCSDLATNTSYKRMYPFTAPSLKEFVSWNVGKRRSSEWSRARIIRKILLTENIQSAEDWNTKAILMYGRSHDYTPFISYGLFNRDSEEKNLLMCCYSGRSLVNDVKSVVEDTHEVNVDVDSDTEMASKKKVENLIDITDPHTKTECSYIRQTARDCGVILKPEEIVEGVKVNGAEMMILEAVKCLAENLIRRAKNHRVCTRTLSPNTSAINREDVEVAINERPEMFHFRQLTNERRNEYFFEY